MRYLTLAIALLSAIASDATHVIGGEMYYDYLGGEQYQFTVKLYRDCSSGSAELPNSIAIGVYDGLTNTYLFQQTIQPTGPAQNVPVELDNPCLTVPPNACVETRTFIGTFTLPFNPNGYQLSYQVCCRTGAIVNVIDPGDVGLTLVVRVPGEVFGNSSPRYVELPPVALCLNETLVFDHSATDPDGNQLVYELCSPYLGATPDAGTIFNPLPGPVPDPSQETAPPYTFIPWGGGYSATNPIISNPPITIDPITGILTVRPTQIGNYVIGVCVSEYQDGVLLSTSRRDFMFQVVPCDAAVNSVITPQTDFCSDLTMQFANGSTGSPDLLWDFGEPGTNADVSTAPTPTWTYSQPGTYTVTLITGPGLVCADTTTAVFNVFLPPVPSFVSPEPQCGSSDVVLTATGGFGSGATVAWDFGAGATPATGQGAQVSSTFGTSGVQPVTVTVTENGCVGSFTGNVEVYPIPVAGIAPQTQFCTGLTIAFGNTSSGATSFEWNFGESGSATSTLANPTHTYTTPGTYVVTLVATAGICSNTSEAVFQVFENPEPFFTVPVAACGVPEVELTAEGTFSNQANVTWNFGAGATPPTATGVTVSTVFPGTGPQVVTVTVTESGCTGTYSDNVVVYAQPDAFFTGDPEPPLPLGATVVFTDQSTGNGGSITSRVWSLDGVDVGEGLSWTWVNAQPGDHTITLTITTADGCSDTYTIDYFITPEDIVIPNVFTPNSDGLNDRFVIENVQYYRNELTIFNRWGQPIYEADNYRNQWGGSDVPDGTYYYVLRLTDSSREYTGHVTVLR
jgi:gliding motility-associated-like protein